MNDYKIIKAWAIGANVAIEAEQYGTKKKTMLHVKGSNVSIDCRSINYFVVYVGGDVNRFRTQLDVVLFLEARDVKYQEGVQVAYNAALVNGEVKD